MKRIKYLGINLPKETKDLYIETYKTPIKEITMAPHSSTGAWKIPWTEEPGMLQSKGLRRVRRNRSDLALMHAHLIFWSLEKKALSSRGRGRLSSLISFISVL